MGKELKTNAMRFLDKSPRHAKNFKSVNEFFVSEFHKCIIRSINTVMLMIANDYLIKTDPPVKLIKSVRQFIY